MYTKMAQVRFVARISSMGDRLIINIPKDFQSEVKGRIKTKQVKITIEELL
jgi:hypothetical protein